MTTCEEVIEELLAAIFEWPDEYSEESKTRSSELRIKMSKQILPCQDFLSFVLLILKGRAVNPDEPDVEFHNPQIRFVIDEYYKSHYHYEGNRFLPVIHKKKEHFPIPCKYYIVHAWKNGQYRLGYFFTVLNYIGPLLFTSEYMVYGLELAEKELELDKGTLVKDWEYFLSINKK